VHRRGPSGALRGGFGALGGGSALEGGELGQAGERRVESFHSGVTSRWVGNLGLRACFDRRFAIPHRYDDSDRPYNHVIRRGLTQKWGLRWGLDEERSARHRSVEVSGLCWLGVRLQMCRDTRPRTAPAQTQSHQTDSPDRLDPASPSGIWLRPMRSTKRPSTGRSTQARRPPKT